MPKINIGSVYLNYCPYNSLQFEITDGPFLRKLLTLPFLVAATFTAVEGIVISRLVKPFYWPQIVTVNCCMYIKSCHRRKRRRVFAEVLQCKASYK
jgi:hypothetical protein